MKIRTMTNNEIKKLANNIYEADNGYGNYSVEEINKELYQLGLTNENGEFLTNLTNRKKEIADAIIDLLG